MRPRSQRDPRWASKPLGFSKNTSIGSHGCTITCIGMLADVDPDYVNEQLKRVNGFANSNLVIWSKIPEALPNLKFIKRVYGYNNADVLANMPCLIEVDFDGTPRTDDRHWVVFIGNKRLYDPWTGKEESTGKYKILRGYSVIKVQGNIGIQDSEVTVVNPPPPAIELPPPPPPALEPTPPSIPEPEPIPEPVPVPVPPSPTETSKPPNRFLSWLVSLLRSFLKGEGGDKN